MPLTPNMPCWTRSTSASGSTAAIPVSPVATWSVSASSCAASVDAVLTAAAAPLFEPASVPASGPRLALGRRRP